MSDMQAEDRIINHFLTIFFLCCPICDSLLEYINALIYTTSNEVYEYEVNQQYPDEYWKLVGNLEAYTNIEDTFTKEIK